MSFLMGNYNAGINTKHIMLHYNRMVYGSSVTAKGGERVNDFVTTDV